MFNEHVIGAWRHHCRTIEGLDISRPIEHLRFNVLAAFVRAIGVESGLVNPIEYDIFCG